MKLLSQNLCFLQQYDTPRGSVSVCFCMQRRSVIFLIPFILFYHWLVKSRCLNIISALLKFCVSPSRQGRRAVWAERAVSSAAPLLQASQYVPQPFPFLSVLLQIMLSFPVKLPGQVFCFPPLCWSRLAIHGWE